MSANQGVLHLRPEDNVAVAVQRIDSRASLQVNGFSVTADVMIPQGHKIALTTIELGEPIRKYGQIIGFASEPIAPGDHVHVHNVAVEEFERDYAYCTECPPDPTADQVDYFMGFERPDGRVGTRNFVAIISTVNCSATSSRYVADRFKGDALADYPNIDGVFAVTHKVGCGMEYGGIEHNQLSRVLAGFAKHPNVGAYVIIGLGCETGQPSFLVDGQKLVQIVLPGEPAAEHQNKPRVLTVQECGGVQKTVDAAEKMIRDMLPSLNSMERTRQPVSKLVLGTECGGSDGNSGITANPALGVASDLIVAQGGTSILAETTEVYGAEHLLTRRAKTREIGEKLVERIRWWEWYANIFGAAINNNPSVGNKDGGLTTIYEKSLGAVAKGGSAPLSAVYEYAEQVTDPGFVFMDTPGFDPPSVTGMVAGGANVVVFTTGRGSCYGCKPTPSIKVATNSEMYERMVDDMDINAGVVLDGESLETVGRRIYDHILAVASGEKTKSENQGIGDEEIAPWSIGPIF